jgi:hypothetical protein
MEKFRIIPIRIDSGYTVLWNTFPDDIVDKLLPHYYYNCRCINEDGSIETKTFICIEPVKKFRKKETVIKFSENIEIGLDD